MVHPLRVCRGLELQEGTMECFLGSVSKATLQQWSEEEAVSGSVAPSRGRRISKSLWEASHGRLPIRSFLIVSVLALLRSDRRSCGDDRYPTRIARLPCFVPTWQAGLLAEGQLADDVPVLP